MVDAPHASLKSKVVHEAEKFFAYFIYLWILFGLFSLHKAIIFQPGHLVPRLGFACFNALIMAKVMLLADDFRVGERFHFDRLIFAILFKAATFSFVMVVFDIVEEIVLGHFHGKDVAQSLDDLGGGSLTVIVSIGVIMFFVLIPFFAFTEIDRVTGQDKLVRVLLTRKRNG
jgi:hypothetical protein